MDGQIYLIIAATFVGFITLAFVLLYPVHRFLNRQERIADDWTPDALARRQRRGGDGAPGPPPGAPEAGAPEAGASTDQM